MTTHRPLTVDDKNTAPAPTTGGAASWRVLTVAAGVVGGAVLVALGMIALVRGDTVGSGLAWLFVVVGGVALISAGAAHYLGRQSPRPSPPDPYPPYSTADDYSDKHVDTSAGTE